MVSTLLATPESGLLEVSEGTAEAIELLSSREILRPIRFLGAVQG